ncbi:MAG TPA: hypothetical protein PKY59_23120 [Pyrinomonadaceae bacterium]|nr:hypothetical protein [Pyrinomonadaceae bacterium]
MKKNIFLTLILITLCSFTALAGDGDGTTHSGGKTCPQGQQTCLVELPQETQTKSVYIEIFDYLKELFG